MKLQTFGPANLLKETPTLVFSWNIAKFLRTSILKKHLRTAAS